MIVGIGVDIVEISRIKQSIERFGDHFINKIFTPAEIAYCSEKANRYQHYAARFAAKEAIYKAFGNAHQPFVTWLQVEINTEDNGRPVAVILNPNEILRGLTVQISLSHSDNYAVCSALVLSEHPAE